MVHHTEESCTHVSKYDKVSIPSASTWYVQLAKFPVKFAQPVFDVFTKPVYINQLNNWVLSNQPL